MIKITNAQKNTAEAQGEKVAIKYFVRGLPKKATEQSLKDYFSKFGALTECKIVLDKDTQQSKGFGFVTFADTGSALDMLAKKTHKIQGKYITVEPSESKDVRDKKEFEEMDRKIFVANLAHTTTKKDLENYFSQFGNVERIDPKTEIGNSFILFRDRLSAINAVQFEGVHKIKEKIVEVRPWDPNREKSTKPKSLQNSSFRQGGCGSDCASVRSIMDSQTDGGYRGSYGSNKVPKNDVDEPIFNTRSRNRNQLSNVLADLGIDPSEFRGQSYGPSREAKPTMNDANKFERDSVGSKRNPKTTSAFSDQPKDKEAPMKKFVSRLFDDEDFEHEEIKSRQHPLSDGNLNASSTQVSGWLLPPKTIDRSSFDPAKSLVVRPTEFDPRVTSMFVPTSQNRNFLSIEGGAEAEQQIFLRNSDQQQANTYLNNYKHPSLSKSDFAFSNLKNPHQ